MVAEVRKIVCRGGTRKGNRRFWLVTSLGPAEIVGETSEGERGEKEESYEVTKYLAPYFGTSTSYICKHNRVQPVQETRRHQRIT